METRTLDTIVAQAENDPGILAVILFGSAAREDKNPRDLDVCFVLGPGQDKTKGARKRLEYLKDHDVDLQIFENLPLMIRSRILKEGKVLHCKDEDALYDLANETIRATTYFRHAYDTYLEGVRAGP